MTTNPDETLYFILSMVPNLLIGNRYPFNDSHESRHEIWDEARESAFRHYRSGWSPLAIVGMNKDKIVTSLDRFVPTEEEKLQIAQDRLHGEWRGR